MRGRLSYTFVTIEYKTLIHSLIKWRGNWFPFDTVSIQ